MLYPYEIKPEAWIIKNIISYRILFTAVFITVEMSLNLFADMSWSMRICMLFAFYLCTWLFFFRKCTKHTVK